jgi:predicted phosphodiesterase
MRIALISDLHGNRVAFDAVLADLEPWEADQVICLGDVALTGPQPHATIERLRQLGCPVVQGNTDEWLRAPKAEPVEHEHQQKIEDIAWWCAEHLREEDRVFLRTFQPTITVQLEGASSLLCYHGSPRSNLEGILAETPATDLASMIEGTAATLLAGGHTHTPMLRRYDHRQTIINFGSVGLPFHRTAAGTAVRNPGWAEYGRLTVVNGSTHIEFRAVPVDLEHLAAEVRASGMPHGEWWIGDWIR